jgi:hypothetical protein
MNELRFWRPGADDGTRLNQRAMSGDMVSETWRRIDASTTIIGGPLRNIKRKGG